MKCSMENRMRKLFVLGGTFFGFGLIPVAPGTWTSLAVTLIYYFWKPQLTSALLVLLLTILLGIPAAYFSEKFYRRKDPSQCVIDEVAGQQVALLFFLNSLSYFIASFLLFRFFDILKPFPVKESERLPYGVGIIADDLLAGLYALGGLKLLSLIFWTAAF